MNGIKVFMILLQKLLKGMSSQNFMMEYFLFMKLAIPYVIIYTHYKLFYTFICFSLERSYDIFLYALLEKSVDAKVEGASQRIQEDCMNFAKIVESIGLANYKSYNALLIAFYSNTCGDLSSNVIASLGLKTY